MQTLSLVDDNISLSHGYKVPSSASAFGAKHDPQDTRALMACEIYILLVTLKLIKVKLRVSK